MPESFDVAIVGAGPAGLSVAQRTAKSGLKTVVFEEHPVIGIPVQCGEGISRHLLDHHKINHKNGTVDWIKNILPKQRLFFPGTKIEHGKAEFGVYWMGSRLETFLVNRAKFDQALAIEAEIAGTQIKTATKVIGLRINSKIGAELTTKNSSQQISTIHAKIVVACDGPASRMAASQNIKAPMNYVHAAEWKVKGQLSERLNFYFDHELTPEGYSWVFPSKDSSTIGLTCRKVRNPALRLDRLMKIMEQRFNQKFKKIKLIGGLIPANPSPPTQTHSDRFILAGDAGGFTNPIFYGGISIAILTGRCAGDAIVNAANEDPDLRFSKQNLSRYDDVWQKLPPFNPAIYKGRKILYHDFTNEHLEQMGKLSNKIEIGRFSILKIYYLNIKAAFNAPIRRNWNANNRMFFKNYCFQSTFSCTLSY